MEVLGGVTCPTCKKYELSFLYVARNDSGYQVWPVCGDCGWELYIDELETSGYGHRRRPSPDGITVEKFETTHKNIYQKVEMTKKTHGVPW